MKTHSTLILDGGLASQLEARGHCLNDALWSARLLKDEPEEIAAVHQSFIRAGADIITTASYQATFQGFDQAGLGAVEAELLLRRSVQLAQQAALSGKNIRVAASIGPYGAYLADGSEYTGAYSIDRSGLVEFHRRRWEVLVSESPDIILCETFPNLSEAMAVCELASDHGGIPIWISFSCRDHAHLCDGTPIEDAACALANQPAVQAIGVNCTPPQFLPELIRRIRLGTDQRILAYPNSGEVYDASTRCWQGTRDLDGFATQAEIWCEKGANIIGGCCRVSPEHIHALRARLQ